MTTARAGNGTKAKQKKITKRRPTKKPPKQIEDYLKIVERDKPFKCCKDQKQLAKIVRDAFATGDVYVDTKQYDAYEKIGLAMFPQLFPWQKFLCMCLLCTYRCSDGLPRWHQALVMMARGGGKDGTIAWFSLCLTSKNNPVKKYNVDICANNKDQSMRAVNDVVEFLNDPTYANANKASFYWTKERVVGLDNGGEIKGHTNNARGKDGLRSGCVILNEIHEYEDFKNVNVFLSGLGKRACPRTIYFTTNGDVREGLLDDEMRKSEDILNGDMEDDGYFPFICRIDKKEEAHDETCWYKANPSLYYLPSLLITTRTDYKKWKESPSTYSAFMSKRMNRPTMGTAQAVTEYENIKATNTPIPYDDIQRQRCIVGIDASSISDFTSVSAIFKRDGKIIVINHTWVCMQSKDLGAIKFKTEFPRLIDQGLLTLVDDVEISPRIIADYIQDLKQHYLVVEVCLDDFKFSTYAEELSKIGFGKTFKNLRMVRPSDIARAVPVIESAFVNNRFVWGDNAMLRWATNNTKVVAWRTKTTGLSDVGARVYAKIEPRSRKTDPFMSLVHAMTDEMKLVEQATVNRRLFKARVY